MAFTTMKLFFALAAIAANVITIGLISRQIAMRQSNKNPFEFLRGATLWLSGGIAMAATLGSLYLSEIVHLVPCKLCWYQRIAMYPLAIMLLIAAYRKDHGIRLYAAVLAWIGLAIASWHRLMQAYPSLDSGACAAVGPPCSAPYIKEFGFVTIPYMAMSAFALILVLLWANRVNNARSVATSA
ncbi:MAG: disulfide bond formation protein B [Actinomycetota bacterium]